MSILLKQKGVLSIVLMIQTFMYLIVFYYWSQLNI
jgi:hypothetical protein